MKQRKLFNSLVIALLLTVIESCTSYKNVPYLQNSTEVDLTAATQLYDAKIMPKDVLTITVNCPQEPKTTAMYNLVTQGAGSTGLSLSGSSYLTSQVALTPYLVSNDGNIEFPVLGQIKVAGMTKTELEKYIADEVVKRGSRDIPIVTVSMSNFKVSVLGEVSKPGAYSISNGKVNIFEALALAGDMTIYGRRDCVKVIREDATGKKEIKELNLNDAEILNSSYYQLQQNDIVYVTPNKAKAKNSGIGSETSLWFTSTSIVISMASLLYNILK